MGTTAWTDICSCNICIPHIPVGYAGGRAPKVGALGDAWSSCRERSEIHRIGGCYNGFRLWFLPVRVI
jgi:hypothetical protein